MKSLEFLEHRAASPRTKRIDDAKKKYSRILDRLASGAEDSERARNRAFTALWPKNTRRPRFEQAAEEVRFQLGQADRFREGLVRSGAWHDHIADTFEKWACRASWQRCRTSSRRSTRTLIPRSARPACGSSCAARADASCASTRSSTSASIHIVPPRRRRASSNRTTSFSAAGR